MQQLRIYEILQRKTCGIVVDELGDTLSGMYLDRIENSAIIELSCKNDDICYAIVNVKVLNKE